MVTAADLHGIHVALLTPVDDSGTPDFAAVDRLVTRVLDGGAEGISPVGSTGEGPRLTRQHRRDVTALVRKLVDGHRGATAGSPITRPARPVIAAPSALAMTDAIEEIHLLTDAGADVALVAVPSYYPMTDREIAGFYTFVADASPIPLLVYNIPAMTKVSVPPAVLSDLARHPNVIGIKDSSRDLEYLQGVVYSVRDAHAAEFAVLTGTDTMLAASLHVGAHGAIAASGNVVPELGRRILEQVSDGDLGAAAETQRDLYDVVQAVRAFGTPAGWKAAAALAGLCEPAMVPPALPVAEEGRARLAERLSELGVVSR